MQCSNVVSAVSAVKYSKFCDSGYVIVIVIVIVIVMQCDAMRCDAMRCDAIMGTYSTTASSATITMFDV